MTVHRGKIVLLGPQRLHGVIDKALNSLDVRGKVALISAGWEEDESQDDWVGQQISNELVNLQLFARAEAVFSEDVEMFQLLRERQDRLRELRSAYNLRCDHLIAAARELKLKIRSEMGLDAEWNSAMRMIRRLDREYVARTRKVCQQFDQRLKIGRRPQVARHRQEIQTQLKDVEALLIAGGHVPILLNRLNIFGVPRSAPDLPIVAWSGGTMAIGKRIVFFHDSPPQGPGNAEVLRAGLGLYDGVLPLPHAKTRLKLDDPLRVSLFACRFAPDRCVVMNSDTQLTQCEREWTIQGTATCLSLKGALEPWKTA
jgi:hypothetical protein